MRELVLTGIKEFWPQDEKNAVFFGPWCFANNHKYKFWDQKEFILAQSPWQTKHDVLEATLYIDSLMDRIIFPLANHMNIFHNVNYSVRFWKIYIYPWLMHWLGHCYDRYLRLNCLQQGTNEKLTVKITNNNMKPAKEDLDYMGKMVNDHYYNLSLMSDIIEVCRFDFLIPEPFDVPYENTESEDAFLSIKGSCLKTRISKKIKRYLKSIKLVFRNYLNSSIYLGDIYGISIIDRFILQFSYDRFFLLKSRDSGKLISLKGKREDLIKQPFDFSAQNEFEKFVQKMIFLYMPDSFLTIYLRKGKSKLKANIWIGNDVLSSEKHAFRVAEICDHGGRWISVQHGAGYGQFFAFSLGKIEYELSGGFITWGWNYKHIYTSNYFPLPSPFLSKLSRQRREKNQLTYVTVIWPIYYWRLHSGMLPEDLIESLEDKKCFFSKLEDQICSKTKYKPYYFDYGVGDLEFISKVLSKNQFITNKKFDYELRSSKLVVIDYLSTTVCETFTRNIPTILFWNTNHFAITTEVSHYFDILRSAGILFDNPESAAEQVNKIWVDVQGWWQQPEVQKAKDEYCCQFARTNKAWRKEWMGFMKELRYKRST